MPKHHRIVGKSSHDCLRSVGLVVPLYTVVVASYRTERRPRRRASTKGSETFGQRHEPATNATSPRAAHRPIHIGPAAFHPNVGLVHPPRAVGWPQTRPDPLLKLRRIGLDPTEDGGVVDRDAAVLQHEFEVAVRDRELQVSTHRPQDHLRRELTTLERVLPVPHALAASLTPKTAFYPMRISAKSCNRTPQTAPRGLQPIAMLLSGGRTIGDVTVVHELDERANECPGRYRL